MLCYYARLFAALAPSRQGLVAEKSPQVGAPGIGAIMALKRMRHVKCWLAGPQTNWQLADRALDELHQGCDDIVKYDPSQDGVQSPSVEIAL